jgi:hypothetical protein
MPTTQAPSRGPGRSLSPRGKPPMWAQWVLALGVATILVAALIVWVDHEQATANEPAPVVKPSAIAEQNREATVLVGQDQAPHTFRIAGPTASVVAVRDAVDDVMRAEIKTGMISGELQGTSCSRLAPGSTATRSVFRCTAEVGSVNYPFDGVVEPQARRVTVCKHDLSPIPRLQISVSDRCT